MEDVIAEDWEVKEEPREWILVKCDGKWQVSKMLDYGAGPMLPFVGAQAPTEWIKVREVIK